MLLTRWDRGGTRAPGGGLLTAEVERLTAERDEFKKGRDALRRRVDALTAQQTVTTNVVRGDGGERIEITICSRCSSVVAVKREDGDSDG